jgi:hypothetical protein
MPEIYFIQTGIIFTKYFYLCEYQIKSKNLSFANCHLPLTIHSQKSLRILPDHEEIKMI